MIRTDDESSWNWSRATSTPVFRIAIEPEPSISRSDVIIAGQGPVHKQEPMLLSDGFPGQRANAAARIHWRVGIVFTLRPSNGGFLEIRNLLYVVFNSVLASALVCVLARSALIRSLYRSASVDENSLLGRHLALQAATDILHHTTISPLHIKRLRTWRTGSS